MRFKRSKPEETRYPHVGREDALDGHTAALATESLAADVVLVQNAPDFADVPQGVERAGDAGAVTAQAAGSAATGARAAAFVNTIAEDSLRAAAARHLPCVFHLTCRTVPRHAAAFHGSHDDYAAASDTGVFQLFARDAQEAADFALIAHRAAELSLTPGLVAQDLYRTSHSVRRVRVPDDALVAEYLGRSGDEVETPTPSQRVLFGERRRRVPRLVDVDRPAGVGGIQDAEGYVKALAAQHTYFAAHVQESLERAADEFAALTGRRYAAVSGYRVDDADVVVVAQGAVIDELEAAAELVRTRDRIKAGVINLTRYRPFPAAEIAALLKGKRAVTVLDRTGGNTALGAEVRATLEGTSVYGGVYGVGAELPGVAELVPVFRNMVSDSPKERFYVGFGESPAIRRFPHLHSLQQALGRDYPARDAVMLNPDDAGARLAPDVRSVKLCTLSTQGGIFAGNVFARVIAQVEGHDVRTFPDGGLQPSRQTARFTLVHTGGESAPRVKPSRVDTVLVAGGKLVEDVSSRARLIHGGTLVVETNRDAEGLWNGLSKRTGRWIHDNALRLRAIDATRIAEETASQPSFVDQLAVWALLGAYAASAFPAGRIDAVVAGIREELATHYGAGHRLLDDVAGAVRRGAEEVADVDYAAYGTEQLAAASDGEAPWTVKDATGWDETLFDAARFWHSVGYLYDSGQADWALSDPHLATGVIPARSSAFRDMTPYRLRIPEWLPENCTGCGECWAQCPDSALPSTVHGVDTMIDTAMSLAERDGVAFVQLKRFAGHLVKRAYKLVAGDGGLNRYTRMDALLDEAYGALAPQLGLDDEKRAALDAEFAEVRARAGGVAVATTETFFTAPHEKDKGTGALLSIALNPLACTGCGICIDVCPEGALAWAPQTIERVDAARAHWTFQLALPDVDAAVVERVVSEDDASTHVHRLLRRNAYDSLVGGDASYPGSGAKTALHLVAAGVESAMKPRVDAHVVRLGELIDGLKRKIQGDVTGVLEINDFDAFTKRLDRIEQDQLTPDTLASLASDQESTARGGLDPEALRRLTGLLDALETQRRLYTAGPDGRARARMAVTIDTESLRLWSGTYPYNPLPVPWACHVPGDAVPLALGIQRELARQVADEAAVCRRARLELSGETSTDGTLDPRDLTDDERALIPPVVVLGDRATKWDAVVDAMSAAQPLMVVLVDPVGESLERVSSASLESNLLSLARGNPSAYVVQTGVGAPGHVIRSAARAVERNGSSLLHVYAPDPLACGLGTEETARTARLAVQGRVVPLFEATGARVEVADNPDAARAWAERAVTFKEPSGAESTLKLPVTVADWAVGQARFQRHFKVVPKGSLHQGMTPLSSFIEMDAAAREGVEPFIHVAGKDGRHLLAIVDADMVRAAQVCRDFWRMLQGSATPADAKPVQPAATTGAPAPKPEPAPASAPATVDASAHRVLTERLLQLCGFSEDPAFFEKSLREFIVERNATSTDEPAS